MKKIHLLILVAAGILAGGCFFTPSQPVSYYELNLPAPLSTPGVQIAFNDFENISGAGLRMRYRSNGNQQVIDNLNRWGSSPENMLRLYLMGAMTDSTDTVKPMKHLTVNGRLEIFEIDLDNKEAIMQFSYSIQEKAGESAGSSRVVRSLIKFTDGTPMGFARAFSEAANDLAKAIRNDIKNHY